MSQKSGSVKEPAEKVVQNIRRATRKRYSAEDKIRIVLEGLRGEDSIAELCRREGIAQSLYYKWSKDFMEAGKMRLAGDIASQAPRIRGAALRRLSRPGFAFSLQILPFHRVAHELEYKYHIIQ